MTQQRGPFPSERSAPRWLEVIGAWGWRFVGAAAGLFVIIKVLGYFEVVVIPIGLAVLLSTAFSPPAHWLRERGCPPALATFTVFLTGAATVALLGLWIVPRFAHEISTVGTAIGDGVDQVEHWFIHGPLDLSAKQVSEYRQKIGSQLTSGQQGVTSRVIQSLRTVLDVVVGLVVTLVLTFFFVKDGRRIVDRVLDRVDPDGSRRLRSLSDGLWYTIGGYIRGTAANGVVNAIVLSIGLLILGVPLVLPLAVITFIGAFIPLVGAFVAGGAAALVALAANGVVSALLVVGLTIVIHNVEGYLVGPFVMGRAVHLPPAAVLVALSAGSVAAGAWGLLLAVPTVACGVTVYRWALDEWTDDDNAADDGNEDQNPDATGVPTSD